MAIPKGRSIYEDDPLLNPTFSTESINRRRAGQKGRGNESTVHSTEEGGNVNPASYGTDFIGGSDQWYGQGNTYGANSMASDPTLFWSGYGEDVQGWDPAGEATAFMASTFNPRAMGAAAYGAGDFASTEEYLGGQTAIANALSGKHAQFVDPAVLVGNVMNALKGGAGNIDKANPILAQIINGNVGNPMGQTADLINFLGEALSGSMP